MRCAFCLNPIQNPRAPSVLRVRLDNQKFGVVELFWHKDGAECHVADPLHLELADALDARGGHRGPDTPESIARVFGCYFDIRNRIAAVGGARKLREAVAVLRDTTQHGLTLRGPGLEWGRNCRITRPKGKRK